MMVFPEGGLGISPETSTEIQLGNNFVSLDYPEYLHALTGIAFNCGTYVVANVVEKVKCSDPLKDKSRNCQDYGFHFYNTDLVFDRNGTLIQKYQKYNLYEEKNLDQPSEPKIVTFDTDFGLKFGIFTGSDILCKRPAQGFTKSQVDGIIYLSSWHSELPFLTALQTQQMWAYAYDLMLFAAGENQPDASIGGTAIHRGAQGALASTYLVSGEFNVLIYHSEKDEVTPSEYRNVDDLGKEMDAFSLMVDDSLKDYKYLTLNTSKNQTHEQLCYQNEETQTNLCCNFDIKLTTNSVTGDFYTYLLVAYAGIRKDSEARDPGLEVCAVIACLNSSISSCGRRFPKYENIQWPVVFEEMKIKAVFDDRDDKIQFPNSLLASIRPIDASETKWTSRNFENNGTQVVERIFEITKPQDRILTFGIYGRNFEEDRDSWNSASFMKITVLIFVCFFVLLAL